MNLNELIRSTNLLKLIAALSVISVVAIAVTITALYRLALDQHGTILTESLSNQVALMHTMQQLEEGEVEKDEHASGMLVMNAIKNMQQANLQSIETGHSSEYTVAKRDNDHIVFLLLGNHASHNDDHEHMHRPEHVHDHDTGQLSVAYDSELAVPMRRALPGKSGTTIGLDHHGEKVLAAYQYMPEYKLGIVAKVDLDELMTPYLLIILLASFVAIVFIFVGAYAFTVAVRPFHTTTAKKAERLRKQHEIMSQLVEKRDADPCNMSFIFEETTEAACEGLGVSRVSLWFFSDDRSNILCADSFDQSTGTHDLSDDMEVAKYPSYFKALETGTIVVNDNATIDPETGEMAEDYLIPNNIRAMLDLPIRVEGEISGILCHEQIGKGHEWSLEDQNFARSIADHISMAMTNCQRNKAEQYLKESEQRYEVAVDGSSDGLWDWDLSSNEVYRSPQYKLLLGYEKDEFNDNRDTLLTQLHPDDRERDMQALNAHLENADIPYDVEYRMLTKSGHYRWFRCRGSALRDADGKPYRVSGSIMDVTDLKQIQSNLVRYKQTLDEISENIFMFDPDTLKFFYVNKSAIDNTGYSEDELMQMNPVDLKPEFTENAFREMANMLISRPDESLVFETIQQYKDGTQVPVEAHLQYIAPSDASPRFVAIIRNISERRSAEIQNYIQRTMLEHIYKVQDDFISGEDRHTVFEQLLNGILDITESEFGFIGEVIYPDDEPPYLHTRYISDIAWNDEMQKIYDRNSVDGFEFRKLDNLFGDVITTGKTVISNNPGGDSRSGNLPEGHPQLESFMGIPLKQGNKLTGMIGIANRHGGYTEELIKELQPLLSTSVNMLDAERAEALRNSMENALRTSEEKANTVLATVADGIITINNKGIVESFNPAAEKLFGYNADEVIGQNVNLLMPEPYHNEHDGYIKHYNKTGEARIIGAGREVDGKRKDGTIFPLDLSVSEMHQGETRRFTGVVRDISQRREAEAALIAAVEEAETANRTKSEFLSSMSHELRTPLNAIMGFAQLLQFDTSLSSAQNKHAKEIYGAGNLLLDLINDVLDLAKIEAGHIHLSIESVMLGHILEDCFKLIEPQAEKNGIKLDFEANSCDGIWVQADNTRLKQILLNLLSNAIKYNKKKGTVNVSCQTTTEGFQRIRISDSGRGMRKKDIKNLFQPFNRLGAERGDIEGTGIGLVITRKLVELMGGSISVESEHGKGTSFMIDLPSADAVVPVNEATDQQQQKPHAANHEETRILVAEDNLTNQELIALQLDTLGYKSDVVANGKEAIEMLQSNNYDMLLTDIHMPEMNGYELTHSVRDSTKSHIKNMTIIAITANAAIDEATNCLEHGMNDYLSKPVNINELQNKLSQWLPGTEGNTSIKAANEAKVNTQAQTETPDQNTATIDPDMLTRYVGVDPEKHKHFFKLFLDTAPETIRAIHQAHKNHSCSGIKDTCHKLKSSARAIGAIKLSTLCQQLETASADENWELIDETMPQIDAAMSEVESYILEELAGKKEVQVQFNFNDVLIVDDDLFVLDLVTSRLNSMGIDNVMTASSGEEALSFLKSSSRAPSVLLLDLNMPGMDGVEFLRHLSELSYQGNIILISGEDTRLLRSAENIARDRSLNILGALEKPITIPPLTELLLGVGAEQTIRPLRSKISLTKGDLRKGIENNEFVVYYQPQIDIVSKQLSGVEALVRWIHPELGMIPPDSFIPVAEELNLINDMTDIILSKAMKQCSNWRDQGVDVNLSVNISVDSLDRLDLPEYIVDCATQHELDISKIMLEITESRLMQDITSALDILTRLSLKGIGLSIDDFGTGYSSMEQLQRVPFKELKIDRSFVNSAVHNKAARAILESSVELAQKLNMTIVAEGVETNENLTLVAGLGCTTAQGYFIGKPMPGNELIGWHQDWKSKN